MIVQKVCAFTTSSVYLSQCHRTDTADALQAIRKTAFIESLSWTADEAAEIYVGGKENRLVSYIVLCCYLLTVDIL